LKIKENYSSNYIKIYFWQGLSILLGLLSMFVVTPFISNNKSIFGIYSVCISISVFLAYADLGFLGAGQKYAAEEYARGNLDFERRIIGFSGFILLTFVLILSLLFIFLSIYPTILISELSVYESGIASKLLLILGIFAPVTVIHRITQMIYSIRIEEFFYQRLLLIGNLIKIISVFFFFRSGHYNIVGYFAFFQIINFIVGIIALLIANKRYSYKILSLVKAFQFDNKIFKKTQKLAFSSLFLTFSWILYYEIDNFVIGRLLGAEKIAIYAVGFTLMTFIRSIIGVIFSPFVSRFNHYIGMNDSEGLKKSFSQVINLTFPIVVLSLTTIILLIKPLIFTWVGPEYNESVNIARFLIACNLFAFITYPTGLLLSAQVRIKVLYFMGGLLPLVYWAGVALTYSNLGLEAFALFKLIAFILSALIYLGIAIKYLGISLWKFLKDFVFSNILSILLLSIVLLFLRDYLPLYKSKIGLLKVISLGAITALFSLLPAFIFNRDAKKYFKLLGRRL